MCVRGAAAGPACARAALCVPGAGVCGSCLCGHPGVCWVSSRGAGSSRARVFPRVAAPPAVCLGGLSRAYPRGCVQVCVRGLCAQV